MKTEHAFRTVAEAMHNAKAALKPAIADLAATQEDHYFETVIRMYLAISTQERKAHRVAVDASRTEY